MMPRAWDFRKLGRDALTGNWMMAILVTLMAVILGALSIGYGFHFTINITVNDHVQNIWYYFPSGLWWSFYSLIVFFIGAATELGLCAYYINLQRKDDCGVENLFQYFSIFGRALLLRLYIWLLVFLWSLLLVIPGIIAAYRYSMAPYLMSQNCELTVTEAVNLSKQMTYGHKGRLFCLDISFFGWILLGSITFGLGMLFVIPYILSSRAAFFLDLNYHYHQEHAAQQQVS